MAQWPGTSLLGLNAQPPLGRGRDTPIMPLLSIPSQTPGSQVNLSPLWTQMHAFLHGVACFWTQIQLAFLHGVACFCVIVPH